jgi:hypothetical protein
MDPQAAQSANAARGNVPKGAPLAKPPQNSAPKFGDGIAAKPDPTPAASVKTGAAN